MRFFKGSQLSGLKSLAILSLLLLIHMNVACTSRRSTDFSDEDTEFSDTDSDPFGDLDDASTEDDIFNSDFDFDDSDFEADDTEDIDEEDITDEDFEVDISDDMIDSCIPAGLFPNLGGLYADDGQELSCFDANVTSESGMNSVLQVMLMQALYSFDYMNKCLGVAVQYAPIAARDPNQGFILAELMIVNCYREVYKVIAASRAYAVKQREKMQSKEKDYLQLLMFLLQDDEFED